MFISYIVPDGRFSAATINKNTQVIVMDEWTPDSLSCEDAKRILQGIPTAKISFDLPFLNYKVVALNIFLIFNCQEDKSLYKGSMLR